MNRLAVFFGGHTEILVILVLLILFFGAKKLPELARSLGKSLNEFKRGREDHDSEKKSAKDRSSHLDQHEEKEK